MPDVATALKDWSATSSSNGPAGGATIGTGLDDNLREVQGVFVRGLSHKGADIASATTTDLGAIEGLFHDITGTTTITSFGTVREGILKIIKFEGALTLTHNATSLILPGAANITTADGDVGILISEGSGNWRCLSYSKTNGAMIGKSKAVTFTRDLTTASGTQSVTGVGFKPSAIQFLATIAAGSSGWSTGMADGTNNYCLYMTSTASLGQIGPNGTACIDLEIATGSGQSGTAVLTSFDSDGFTLTWTKNGVPGSTNASIFALCFR